MSKIDFDGLITDLSGNPIKYKDTKRDTKLKDLVVISLTTPLESDANLSGMEKFEIGFLAQKIYGGGELALPSEDITTIKERLGKVYGPLFVLKAYELIEPRD